MTITYIAMGIRYFECQYLHAPTEIYNVSTSNDYVLSCVTYCTRTDMVLMVVGMSARTYVSSQVGSYSTSYFVF